MELARELRSFIEVHLEGRGDKMIPFSGLVIEHQAVTSSVATEELQILMMGRNSSLKDGSTMRKPRRSTSIQNAILWFGLPLVLSSALSFTLARVDPFAHQSTSTAGVVRET